MPDVIGKGCGSFRHASNGPNGTILRPVTSVGGRTRYRRIRRGFLAGESRVVVTLLSLKTKPSSRDARGSTEQMPPRSPLGRFVPTGRPLPEEPDRKVIDADTIVPSYTAFRER